MMNTDCTNIDDFGEFTVKQWFSNGDQPVTQERDLTIMALGLAGETGEAIEHIKKLIRDGHLDRDAFKKELGDVAFYWARICRYFGYLCSDVLQANVEKLESRRARGTMRGNGDNR
jgi:NTP pyrophosphatase (non-canonical NTP hydrolase)